MKPDSPSESMKNSGPTEARAGQGWDKTPDTKISSPIVEYRSWMERQYVERVGRMRAPTGSLAAASVDILERELFESFHRSRRHAAGRGSLSPSPEDKVARREGKVSMSGGRMKAWRLPEHFRLPSPVEDTDRCGIRRAGRRSGERSWSAAFATRIADARPRRIRAGGRVAQNARLPRSLTVMHAAREAFRRKFRFGGRHGATSVSQGRSHAGTRFRPRGRPPHSPSPRIAPTCPPFPVSGVFGRLWWSTPVHLLSSMFASAGLVPALLRLANGEAATSRADEGKCGGSSGAKSAAAGAALGFAAAFFFHFSANLIVRSGASPRAMAIAGAAMLAALIIVYRALARRMYIGGIFND